MTGDIPGSHSLIYDSDEQRCLFVSDSGQQLDETIREMDSKLDLGKLIDEAIHNVVQVKCKRTDRVFLVRRLAASLYMALSVPNSEGSIAQAKKVMAASLQVDMA